MDALPEALFRPEQVRELDRRAIQDHGIPGYTFMQRAGGAALALMHRRWPGARRVAVVCGGGNNAGDGYVLARFARGEGLAVDVLAVADPRGLRGEAATAWRDWTAAGGAVHGFDPGVLEGADVVVDALLGTGLQRAVVGEWRAAIEAINHQGAPVLALDVPSGLSADTGGVLGAAVQAAATITFVALKRGLFTGEGPERCGRIFFHDLDLPAQAHQGVAPSALRLEETLLWSMLPPRPRTRHKGGNGHVLVIGGERGMAGAVRMAAEAAARTGAGLVSVATRAEHAALISATRPELMSHGVEDAAELPALAQRADVLALGPGLGRGRWARGLLAQALDGAGPLVLDADALNLLAREPARRDDWILTPHPGEAARLLGCSAREVQADRFAALNALVEAYGGTCILKGAGTLVGAAGDRTYVCDAGNPGMASGGMGDVLTGVVAALVAQGLDLPAAARTGAYLHARAGDLAAADGERGMLALDLMPHLRRLANPPGPSQ